MTDLQITDLDGSTSLTFSCGEQASDQAVLGTGHQPNGYFWEGIAAFLRPELAERLELDSEAGMFSAWGEPDDLDALAQVLRPLLQDPQAVAEVVPDAEAQGFEFQD